MLHIDGCMQHCCECTITGSLRRPSGLASLSFISTSRSGAGDVCSMPIIPCRPHRSRQSAGEETCSVSVYARRVPRSVGTRPYFLAPTANHHRSSRIPSHTRRTRTRDRSPTTVVVLHYIHISWRHHDDDASMLARQPRFGLGSGSFRSAIRQHGRVHSR